MDVCMINPRRVLLAVSLTGAVIIACGSTSSPTAGPLNSTGTPMDPGTIGDVSTPTDASSTAVAISPTDSPAPQVASLGDVAEQGGYFLQVLTVQDPVVTDGYVTPGKRGVEVEVIVGNSSGESAYPSDSYLVDSDGQEYGSTVTWVNPLLQGYDVEAGQRERGWIGFEIPETAQIKGLRLAIGNAELYSGLVVQPGAVLAPLPPRTVPQYPRLGEVVSLDGYTLSILGVIDPAQPVPGFFSAPSNTFAPAKAGMRLVAVEATIENVSGRELYVYPEACLLIDMDGFIYLSAFGAVENEMNDISLNPGDRTSGLIAFPILPNAGVEALKCEIGSFGVVTILVSGLTK